MPSFVDCRILRKEHIDRATLEKKKSLKVYVQKYGVKNLYKYNLDRSKRLIYTLATDESGIAVVIIEILNHKDYEKRFGYK